MKAIKLLVDYSIMDSLASKPQVYADAILPFLLPALRLAIGTFMSDLVANIQQILERSLSAESIKWRIEALRTGRPFSEIAVLHSLIYRVEQVLLINHQSGLLLDHVEIPDTVIADADLISGMLTAITDFIQDTFQIQNTTSSGTMQYGQQLIWIERGRNVTIAAIVRGQPSPQLRELLQNALKQVESRKMPLQEGFATEYLKPCLAAAYQPKEQKSNYWRNIAIGIVAAVLLCPVLLLAIHVRSLLLLKRYESLLKTIPGIVVTRSELGSGHFNFYGFMDRYTLDPRVELQKADLDPKEATLDLKPFVSEDSSILERRLRVVLAVPQSIEFHLKNGILHLTGSAPLSWMNSNRDRLTLMSGVIPFDMSELKDTEYLKIRDIKEKIERQTFPFQPGVTMYEFTRNLKELNRLSKLTQRDWTLLIQGQRANEVARTLEKLGIPSRKIRTARPGSAGEDGRAVHFQVTVFDSRRKGHRAS